MVVCDVLTKPKWNKCFTFPSLHLWSIMRGLRNTRSCVLNTVQQRWMTKWPRGIRGLTSRNKTEIKNRGAKILQNSSSQLKILGARKVTRSNCHTVRPHILKRQSSPHYRPGQAQRVPRKLSFPDFVTTAQDGGRLSALRIGRLCSPGNAPGTHFC
jgi:hypothetical protein